MARSDLKTRVNDASVTEFLDGVADERRRKDCHQVLRMMQKVTGEPPKMWGASIVGFGSYHYRGTGGREGDWPMIGFSPRKQNLTLYLMEGVDHHATLLARLGKFTTGASCLYLKRLDDVDPTVLMELVQASVRRMKRVRSSGTASACERPKK